MLVFGVLGCSFVEAYSYKSCCNTLTQTIRFMFAYIGVLVVENKNPHNIETLNSYSLNKCQ